MMLFDEEVCALRKKLREMSVFILPFAIAVLIYAFFMNYEGVMGMGHRIFTWCSYILSRFIIGFVLAYLLDLLALFLERRLKFKRALAIVSSYLVMFGLVVCMLLYILPLIVNNLTDMVNAANGFYRDLPVHIKNLEEYIEPRMVSFIEDSVEDITTKFLEYAKGLIAFSTVSNILSSTGRMAMDIFFGLVISAYVLVEKRALIRHARQLTYAVCKTRRADTLILKTRQAHSIFSSYVVGKLVDSAFVTVFSLILYWIMGIPIAPFMALLTGVCNMIPYFGPIVGGTLSCLIMLCFDWKKMVIILIIIIVVQAIDGLILEPKILGDAVGISPLLTIIAVTLGGDMAGFLGMFIGVPVLAIMKILIYDELIAKRISQRKAYRNEGLIMAGEAEFNPDMPLDVNTLDGAPGDAPLKRKLFSLKKRNKKPKAPK